MTAQKGAVETLIEIGRAVRPGLRKTQEGITPRAIRRSIDAFLVVIGVVAIATLLTAGADYFIGDTTIYTFYMLAIIAIGFRYTTPFLVLGSVLSALAYAYFFADPPESFAIERPEVSYALIMLTGVAIVTGRAAGYLKLTQKNLRQSGDDLMEQTRELTAALKRELDARNALRNFVATMCHEFRTPLTTIDIISQNERRRAATGEPGKRIEAVDSVRAEIKRMNELLTSLEEGILHRASTEALRPQPVAVPLDELVRDVCNSQHLTAPNRTILVSGEWPDRPIAGNPRLLRQLFSNLVANAVKYSPPAEPIMVEALCVDRRVEVAVIDRGIGIPDDEISRVFERFYRATNVGAVQGTGLGLALCREIVEEQGGRIWIAKNAPRGTRVTVDLPIEVPAAS